jgi:hypothetical protein
MGDILDPEFIDYLIKKGIPVTLYLGGTIAERGSLVNSFEKSQQTAQNTRLSLQFAEIQRQSIELAQAAALTQAQTQTQQVGDIVNFSYIRPTHIVLPTLPLLS